MSAAESLIGIVGEFVERGGRDIGSGRDGHFVRAKCEKEERNRREKNYIKISR